VRLVVVIFVAADSTSTATPNPLKVAVPVADALPAFAPRTDPDPGYESTVEK
jgi:hypothetical protein